MTDSICVATEAIKSTSISEYSATRTSTGTADVVFDLVPSSKIRYSIHVEFRQPIVATIARPSEPRSGIEDRRCEASSSKDGRLKEPGRLSIVRKVSKLFGSLM